MGPYRTSRVAEFARVARGFCQRLPTTVRPGAACAAGRRLVPVLLVSLAVSGCSALGFTPGSVTLNAGTSTQVNVTLSPPPSSTVPVALTPSNSNVSLGTQAPGASDTVTMPAGGQTQETINGKLAGMTTITAAAMPTQVLTGYKDGTLNVAVNPVLTTVSPANAASGASVAFSGTGFVSGATAIFTPAAGQPAVPPIATTYQSLTMLTALLPQGIGGTYNVLVQANGQSSNTVSYTAAGFAGPRAAGPFTEFSGAIVSSLSPPPSCSTGSVRLQIVQVNPNSPNPTLYQATYTNARTGQPIGMPITFNVVSLGANPVENGGAGFDDACKVGIVLDAQGGGSQGIQERFRFFDLATGSELPAYPFMTNFVGSPNSFYPPRLFDSLDGTIILVVTASPSTAGDWTAAFVDIANGGRQFGTQTQTFPGGSPPVAAAVASNGFQIVLTMGTYTPTIAIPP